MRFFSNFLFWPVKLQKIETLANTRGSTGGLIHRIDENRELLELLQEKAPAFLKANPWVEGWIKANDEFFIQLDEIVNSPRIPGCYLHPRPWPSSQLASGQGAETPQRNVDVEPKTTMYRIERGGISGSHEATQAEVEDFLDACGIVKESAEWEGALIGLPIQVDGSTIRFIMVAEQIKV